MDHASASEADPLIPLSSNAEVNKYLVKINKKLKQLNTNGLSDNNHKTLEGRLRFVWGEPEGADSHAKDSAKLKAWQHTRARWIYTKIQDANDHVFLAAILVISPTEIAKASFQNVVNYLVCLDNYEPYRLILSSADKTLFESISVEQDFTGSRQYLRFMGAVFPQGEGRAIQYAYSYVPLHHIPAFLKEMQEGIFKSRLYTDEDTQKAKASSCLSILVPSGNQDGGCTLVVDRKVLMNAVYKFGLSELKL